MSDSNSKSQNGETVTSSGTLRSEAKMPPKQLLAWTFLVSLSVVTLGWLIYAQSDLKPRTPPKDAGSIEAILKARVLQKQGDLEAAVKVFEDYALQGYPRAMYSLGYAYRHGWGVKPDLDRARHYFLQAVRFEFPERAQSAYEIGRLFQRSQGPDCNTVAVEWFEKSLSWGYAKASLQLSVHYEQGLGVATNVETAIRHYRIASRAGFDKAKLNYALLLMSGRSDVEADPLLASRLINEALFSLETKAHEGSGSAGKQLGRLYRDGEVVTRDIEHAKYWFTHASTLGDPGAMHDLAKAILNSSDDAPDVHVALGWLREAASKNHGGAMTALGRFHLAGKYGLDPQEAVTWFNRGISAGHAGSMEELAWLYFQGKHVAQDPDQALQLALRGSELGHSGSTSLLSQLKRELSNDPSILLKVSSTKVGD